MHTLYNPADTQGTVFKFLERLHVADCPLPEHPDPLPDPPSIGQHAIKNAARASRKNRISNAIDVQGCGSSLVKSMRSKNVIEVHNSNVIRHPTDRLINVAQTQGNGSEHRDLASKRADMKKEAKGADMIKADPKNMHLEPKSAQAKKAKPISKHDISVQTVPTAEEVERQEGTTSGTSLQRFSADPAICSSKSAQGAP